MNKNLVMILIVVILILAVLLYYQNKQVEQKLDFGNDLKISEESGIVAEQIQSSTKPCEGKLADYKVSYKNGGSLDIRYYNYLAGHYVNVDCNALDSVFDITYITKKFLGDYKYHVKFYPLKDGRNIHSDYNGPEGELHWISESEIDYGNNATNTGDINEANDFISVMSKKADDILDKYNSGQIKANAVEQSSG